MHPRERELIYPWAEVPAPGCLRTVRPGVHWLRMPLPFALDHINVWLLEDEVDGVAGFTVVDCGIASEPTRAAWEQIFASAFNGRPLLRVIATHFHPDHLGCAAWLAAGGERQRWQAPLWMTLGEYAFGKFLSGAQGEARGHIAAAHFRAHGVTDEQLLAQVKARAMHHYPALVPAVPEAFRRIMDGDEIAIGPRGAKRVFRVIVGYGHAPEHASLYCAPQRGEGALLISGDMVLPRISTNVSVFETEPEGNPLPRYLRSLDHYLMLPADTLVLPSHGKPFLGLHRIVAEQHAHHAARLQEVAAACATPKSAADIVPLLFPRALDLHQSTFALGEALAHLHALWYDGRLARTRDTDGVYRFARVDA
ncbi:MAG: MBL fold metallo-hydrolase [Sutterellaceae bacterium]|nr:MBL fold metallo-hydrolase [Burkholderiaceae bacterium]MDW8430753.1 MBL fold metallo-hydrolase [Sutterellaceae bacterium]